MAEQVEMPFGVWTRVGRLNGWRCRLKPMSNYFQHLLLLVVGLVL